MDFNTVAVVILCVLMYLLAGVVFCLCYIITFEYKPKILNPLDSDRYDEQSMIGLWAIFWLPIALFSAFLDLARLLGILISKLYNRIKNTIDVRLERLMGQGKE